MSDRSIFAPLVARESARATSHADVFDAAPFGIVVSDPSGRIVDVNARGLRDLGYERGELIGSSIEIVVPEALRAKHRRDREGFRPGDHRAMGGERHLRARRKDGTTFLAEIGLSVVPGGLCAAFIVDVTEREDAKHARESAERRYQALFDSANDAVFVVGEDGMVLEANPQASRLVKRERADIVQHRFESLFDTTASVDHRACLPLAFEQGVALAESVPLRREPAEVVCADLSASATSIDGEAIVFVMARDVTARNKLHAQLRVSDRLASLGMLAAGVAHEINNPLAALLGNLEILSREAGALALDSSTRDVFQEARQAAERVRAIVGDLRVFSRGDTEPRQGPVDVRRVLDSTVRMAKNEIRHRARVITDYAGVPVVNAPESRLGQVFLNLVINAAHAIPDGHVNENEIRIAARLDGESVIVEIADTGCGMPADVLARLFEPFFTTKPLGVGTGLGLSICHRIITSLGGSIAVESVVGRGTRFRITLPACLEKHRSDRPIPAGLPTAVTRVLVIDDDRMVGATIRRLLASGYELTTAATGAEALGRIAAGETFDAILCDLMMPDVSGMDVYEELEKSTPAQARRVVFLTGGAFTPRAQSFMAKRPGAFVEKPFTASALVSAITRVTREPSAPVRSEP